MDVFKKVVLPVEAGIREIEAMDLEALARATGFQKRTQRKIDIRDLALGVLAVVAAGRLSFERVAASIARRARRSYSKQALHKRMGASACGFLLEVFGRCLQPAMREAAHRGLFAPFRRVLIHDSTTLALPPRYAADFPGSTNQHGTFSQVKIQVVCNLLQGRLEQTSFSGFTRNDQRAAPDILPLLRPGDLVIRDLGYFVLSVFAAIIQSGAFFLSRYHHQLNVFDPRTKRQIPLAKILRKQGFLDQSVCLGERARLPVRLVALPVPAAVANQRRRQLRQNRDRHLNPGQVHFFLLGWNIFITNVTPDVWPMRDLPVLYRLRWRIETLFKAWKSHLALNELSDQCLAMIYLSVVAKLIFFALAYRTYHHLETALAGPGRHISFLRLAQLLSASSIRLEAAFVRLSPQRLLAQLIERHAFYEPRPDRPHFQNLLLAVQNPLG